MILVYWLILDILDGGLCCKRYRIKQNYTYTGRRSNTAHNNTAASAC